ncbi:DUF4214 domain-containing protein [Mesorhizobium sp. CAU 1741]|uniref:DUF4214 domain-containing protein n=1 Tax=Mesorhizobium sp. CAU 1741 TaxID=3140366 RepID=UPI00325C06CE
MSSFPYNNLISYGPNLALRTLSDSTANWPDWDNDDQYEAGDEGLTTGPYLGTVTINGLLCPVFQGRTMQGVYEGYVVIYSGPPLSSATVPQSIPLPTNEIFYFGENLEPETGDGVQGVFVALFGRPADPSGLAFFNDATNNGADLSAIGDLASTQEYQSRFEGMSNAQIVASIYTSLFDREPEAAGLAYFVDALDNGTLSINNIAIAVLNGAEGSDKTIIDNKIAASDAFTAQLDTSTEIAAYAGNDAAAFARAWLEGVTNTVPSASEIAEAIDSLTSGSAVAVWAASMAATGGLDDPHDGVAAEYAYHDAGEYDPDLRPDADVAVSTTGNSAIGDLYFA